MQLTYAKPYLCAIARTSSGFSFCCVDAGITWSVLFGSSTFVAEDSSCVMLGRCTFVARDGSSVMLVMLLPSFATAVSLLQYVSKLLIM